MTVDDALALARSHGVRVTLDGGDLDLEADAPPPLRLLAILGCGKRDIVAALRLREDEKRRAIVRWIADNFTSSSPGVCAHCGDGLRSEDPFVLLFVGNDRGEVHASCHAAWIAQQEAQARSALGLGIRPTAGRAPSNSRRSTITPPPETTPVPLPPPPPSPAQKRDPASPNRPYGPPMTAVNRIDGAPSMSADAVMSRERTQIC